MRLQYGFLHIRFLHQPGMSCQERTRKMCLYWQGLTSEHEGKNDARSPGDTLSLQRHHAAEWIFPPG